MSVLKVLEIMSNSEKSWEDATRIGIKKASKTVKKIKSAFVQSHSVVVNDNEIAEYRVTLKISFEVD